MSDANGDETMTRGEATVYLEQKGLRISTTTMNHWASDGTGPPFVMDQKKAFYKKSDLDAFLAAHPPKGATVPAAPKKRRGRRPKGDDLVQAVAELLPLIDKLASGQGSFNDGIRFADALEHTKRALRARRNGAA